MFGKSEGYKPPKMYDEASLGTGDAIPVVADAKVPPRPVAKAFETHLIRGLRGGRVLDLGKFKIQSQQDLYNAFLKLCGELTSLISQFDGMENCVIGLVREVNEKTPDNLELRQFYPVVDLGINVGLLARNS